MSRVRHAALLTMFGLTSAPIAEADTKTSPPGTVVAVDHVVSRSATLVRVFGAFAIGHANADGVITAYDPPTSGFVDVGCSGFCATLLAVGAGCVGLHSDEPPEVRPLGSLEAPAVFESRSATVVPSDDQVCVDARGALTKAFPSATPESPPPESPPAPSPADWYGGWFLLLDLVATPLVLFGTRRAELAALVFVTSGPVLHLLHGQPKSALVSVLMRGATVGLPYLLPKSESSTLTPIVAVAFMGLLTVIVDSAVLARRSTWSSVALAPTVGPSHAELDLMATF